MMIEIQKTYYVTGDGTEFTDKTEAHRYENKEKISKIFFGSVDAIDAFMWNWEELKKLMEPE